VVADLPRLAPRGRLGRLGERELVGDVDLAVVDARPAMMGFAETFFPHLKTNPGQALMVTNVPGAVGRTTMALAIARMAEAVGLTALVVTDHGEAHDLRPSLADVLAGRHDLAALPPPETVDHVSVMGFGGEGDDGFWDVAEDGRLPALMARLTRHWDLVVVESSAPEGENRDVLPPTEAFRAVLLVADRDRNTMDEVADNAELWADDGERLVMVGLNRAA
jgi:MinD-like ATPase involved in chromosome partitioning or flagellar assembly